MYMPRMAPRMPGARMRGVSTVVAVAILIAVATFLGLLLYKLLYPHALCTLSVTPSYKAEPTSYGYAVILEARAGSTCRLSRLHYSFTIVTDSGNYTVEADGGPSIAKVVMVPGEPLMVIVNASTSWGWAEGVAR